MARYDVYVTRFDATGVIEQVPARGLSFSLPLSDHGECSFDATVEPGRSLWRPALALPFSGVLVARDGVPWWDGIVTDERQTGGRTFSFNAREWGWFFEQKVPAVPRVWNDVNDHVIFRQLVSDAQAVSGQNVLVELGTTLGARVSDRSVTAWDKTTVGREFRSVGEADGGPEWYFQAGGTLDAPRRQLILADRAGHATAEAVLEYVEDTEPYRAPAGPPTVALLGDLFHGNAQQVPVRRAGGNVVAQSRSRTLAEAATVVVATGSGEEAAQLRSTATASTLLSRGWPRMTETADFNDVSVKATLDRHAASELAKRAGVATGYSLVTLDGDLSADWTQTPRGSTVRVVLDTDVYGADRPVGGANGFDARCTNVVVRVPDSGSAQVEWQVSDVLEVF